MAYQVLQVRVKIHRSVKQIDTFSKKKGIKMGLSRLFVILKITSFHTISIESPQSDKLQKLGENLSEGRKQCEE